MSVTPPPIELIWAGAATGLLGGLAGLVSIVTAWRNRRRLRFKVVSTGVYVERWHDLDLAKSRPWPGPPDDKNPPGIPVESVRKAFIVLELVVTNEYPTEISVGRFRIDGWMFADKFTSYGYAPLRDYRVFDLHTREPISLESFRKIPPKGTYGLRLEILEEAEGPDWHSSKSRYWIKLPRRYDVEFHSDVGAFRRRSDLPKPDEEWYNRLSWVYHWSDLLPPPTTGSGGAPEPQGLVRRRWRQPWRWRWRNWRDQRVARMLYGRPFRLPDDPRGLQALAAAAKKSMDRLKRS